LPRQPGYLIEIRSFPSPDHSGFGFIVGRFLLFLIRFINHFASFVNIFAGGHRLLQRPRTDGSGNPAAAARTTATTTADGNSRIPAGWPGYFLPTIFF
jgi:hypothetical protein